MRAPSRVHTLRVPEHEALSLSARRAASICAPYVGARVCPAEREVLEPGDDARASRPSSFRRKSRREKPTVDRERRLGSGMSYSPDRSGRDRPSGRWRRGTSRAAAVSGRCRGHASPRARRRRRRRPRRAASGALRAYSTKSAIGLPLRLRPLARGRRADDVAVAREADVVEHDLVESRASPLRQRCRRCTSRPRWSYGFVQPSPARSSRRRRSAVRIARAGLLSERQRILEDDHAPDQVDAGAREPSRRPGRRRSSAGPRRPARERHERRDGSRPRRSRP